MQNKKSMLPELRLQYVIGTEPKIKITSSKCAYSILITLYDPNTLGYRESSYVLFLDPQNKTLGWFTLSLGGTYSTVIDVKLLFATALCCGASGFILTHNHPSGNLSPSESDRVLTKRIYDIGELLNIHLLDHIIITTESYFSFSDNCLL
jgi:DNA repair protein RadC